jgi:hypothetical protein
VYQSPLPISLQCKTLILTHFQKDGKGMHSLNKYFLRTQSEPRIVWMAGCQVAHACNPSYLGSRDQEDFGLRPVQENSSGDLISKIPNTKKG